MNPIEKPIWLKSRGYLHVTPKLDILKKRDEIYSYVTNPLKVQNHGFFPLIHAVIKDRKYKKHPKNSNVRAHVHKIGNNHIKSAKLRPLHYSTHMDSMIFGYYAFQLLEKYEEELARTDGLPECVTAYRKVLKTDKEDETSGKSTIHFANEAFEEIKKHEENGCGVLMFDIKSFFSELDHKKLELAWISLFEFEKLPKDHLNVFKAATDFRYILKDDLRIGSKIRGKKSGFDEKAIAHSRKTKGTESFFDSIEAFKIAIKTKQLKVFKHPFVKNKTIVGIPQGLPISAVLANLYLLDFDKSVLEEIVKTRGGFYRRYSDDILIVCKKDEMDDVERFISTSILDSLVTISKEKTEKYIFEKVKVSETKNIFTSTFTKDGKNIVGKPLTYLGFEFYGTKKLIKSANLAKFYRRIIHSVKRKANRAININEISSGSKPIIFRGRLIKKYKQINLESVKPIIRRKLLVRNVDGTYGYKFFKAKRKHNTNYLSYVNRAASVMGKEVNQQVRKHQKIFNSAIAKHLLKKKI